MEAVESRVFFLSVALSVLPFVWVLKKTLDASRQVDVIIVGFKRIFVMLLQLLWVLTTCLSICCNTHGFKRNSKLSLISGSNSCGFQTQI